MASVALQGVSKLPIGVRKNEALEILEILSPLNRQLGQLDEKISNSPVNQELMRVLLLNESVESTRIEGTQVTFTDMMEEQHDSQQRPEITEVKNYYYALQYGYELVKNNYPISSRLIKELHEILMQGARGSQQASGEFRKVQNFIGPTKYKEDAQYIPISPEKIDAYMQNLEHFINKHPYGEMLPTDHISAELYPFTEEAEPIVKTAIIHAQFESIHPFLDGNGRLGRILIVLSLIQLNVMSHPIFFVSEELEKERARYYDMLNSVRGDNPSWEDWILFFLNACTRMAKRLHTKLDHVEELAKSGVAKCRLDTEKYVWLHTFSDPFTTAKQAAEQLDVAQETARRHLKSLVEKRLLFADAHTKRNRKYRNYDLMRILRD